jgi:DNA-binding NarL/FixJ family response regulator
VLFAVLDESTRLSIARTLTSERCEIVEAGDGDEVLRLLSDVEVGHGSPDVVIMDLRMPRGSGLFVLMAMRRARLETHVVILSANCHASISDYARQFGAMVLSTPLDVDVLRAAIAPRDAMALVA